MRVYCITLNYVYIIFVFHSINHSPFNLLPKAPVGTDILLGNFQCSQSDWSLSDCDYDLATLYQCTHAQDVGLFCSGFGYQDATTTTASPTLETGASTRQASPSVGTTQGSPTILTNHMTIGTSAPSSKLQLMEVRPE